MHVYIVLLSVTVKYSDIYKPQVTPFGLDKQLTLSDCPSNMCRLLHISPHFHGHVF